MPEAFTPRLPEVQEKIEGELPEVRIFDLLSSIGNGENKALELIVMKRGVTYSKNQLCRETMNHQSPDNRWDMDKNLPFSHCEQSLSPIGLVTKEALSPDGSTWGYQITDKGITTGIPFAGLLLKWSHEHTKHSLNSMFGSTASSKIKDQTTLEKKRGQETRYRILWEIITHPNINLRLTDLADAISESHILVGNHLTNLNQKGVISYQHTEAGKPISLYKMKGNYRSQEPEPYRKLLALSHAVYDIYLQNQQETLSREQVWLILIGRNPEYGKLDKKNLLGSISKIQRNLERQGYLEVEKFWNKMQSTIIVSDEQKEAILSLLNTIDRFKMGDEDSIEEGRKFAQRVANDPNLFSELMLRAQEASPNANKKSVITTKQYILSILRDHPRSTRKQIVELLHTIYDKKLTTPNAITPPLKQLILDETISVEKTKSGNAYSIADKD